MFQLENSSVFPSYFSPFMSPHILPGKPTVVRSLSPSLLIYLNTSKVPSLVTSADNSDIPSELYSYHPSIGKIILTSVMPTRDQ